MTDMGPTTINAWQRQRGIDLRHAPGPYRTPERATNIITGAAICAACIVWLVVAAEWAWR